jgi:sugar phosphate isomerase/epimerase
MSILLTLSLRSLHKLLAAKGDKALSLLEVPQFAITELRLHGLNLQASALAGWSLPQLDRLRDRADKAGCPCLVLIEDTPQPLTDPAARDDIAERVRKLTVAAARLGCNAVAISCNGPDSDEAFDHAAATVKSLMPVMDKAQLNLLFMPHEGLTQSPDRLTGLIKRVGGFRIGTLAEFGHAADSGDFVANLRRLAPYAGAIQATVRGFGKTGAHKGYALDTGIDAIRSVGYVNTVAIDYTGGTDPLGNIEKARVVMQAAIDKEVE